MLIPQELQLSRNNAGAFWILVFWNDKRPNHMIQPILSFGLRLCLSELANVSSQFRLQVRSFILMNNVALS